MAKPERQPFTPRGPFTVARPFRWEGRDYRLEEDFDAKRMAIPLRRLRLLWDSKHIEVRGDYLGKDDEKPQKAKEPPKEPVKDPVTPLEAKEGEFLYDPEIHAVEKDDKEFWIADEAELLVRITPAFAKKLGKTQMITVVPAAEIMEWPEAADDKDAS